MHVTMPRPNTTRAVWILVTSARLVCVSVTLLFFVACNQTAQRPIGCVEFEIGDGFVTCFADAPLAGGVLTDEELAVAVAEEPLTDIPTTAPASFSLRSAIDGCAPVHFQGRSNWCTRHAASSMLEVMYCSQCGRAPRISVPSVNYRVTRTMSLTSMLEGMKLPEGVLGIASPPGVLNESRWPNSNVAVDVNRAFPGSVANTGSYRALDHHTVAPSNIGKIERILASGRPLMASIQWFDRATFHNAAGDISTAAATGSFGMHAILVIGYDRNAQRFTFLNSFGANWGTHGYGTFDYAFMRRFVERDLYYFDNVASTADIGCSNPEMPSCANATSCDACASLSGCGWCGDGTSGTCVSGSGGPCAPDQFRSAPDECPLAGACAGLTDCEACTSSPAGCSFCGGIGCYSRATNPNLCTRAGQVRVAVPVSSPAVCRQIRGCVGQPHETCVALAGCGWCADVAPGHCTASGPGGGAQYEGACTNWSGGPPPASNGPGTGFDPDAGPQEPDAGEPEDPCADIPSGVSNCQTCIGTAGCAMCDDTCVSEALQSVCSGTWRDTDDSCDSCASAASTCGECIDVRGCGWCNGVCMSLTRSAECPRPHTFADAESECTDCGALAAGGCATCTANFSCGWCPDERVCVADPSGPALPNCAGAVWGSACP